MSTANTDAYNLSNVDLDGILNEDVMQTIFNIDPVDLPYTDMAGREDSKNPYKSWVKEGLATLALPTPLVDGADAPNAGTFDEARVGNHHQIIGKTVRVSKRARNVDAIGYDDRLIHELMIRQKELRKEMEAALVSNQASVEATSAVAGQMAGAAAMFETNIINGTAGGFSAGIYSAPTEGAARALTEDDLRDAGEAAYSEGGNPRILMSTPQMIRGISEYLFSSTARIATLSSDVTTSDNSQGRYGNQGVTAIGSVNTFVSDFDTFTLTPNRSQLPTDTNEVNVFMFDPDYWAVSYIYGITTEELAKTGLADNRLMSVDMTNVAKQEKSSAIIMGINPTLAVTAS
jgi:hypothetical protein